MRRPVRYLRRLWSSKPRIVPFLPVVARALVRRGSQRPEREPPAIRPLPAVQVSPPPASGLTVFSIIRNGIANGYPFVEAYGSWLAYADRVLVVDGESDDGTREALAELARIDARVEIVSRPWPQRSDGGSAIADLTNVAIELAAGLGGRLMYVQADEVYTQAQRELIRGHGDGALEFAGCVNFWNSLDSVVANEFPMRYLRLFPATAGARSIADGYSFALDDVEIRQTPELFLHYGWCFPEQILNKHVSHGRLYRDDPGYRLRGWLAGQMLAQRVYDRRLLDALAPHYRPAPFRGEHPECIRHLLGLVAYDPMPGLEILAGGTRW